MKKIAIIQMGLPPEKILAEHGSPASWFACALKIPLANLLVKNPAAHDTLPGPEEFDVAIITGSWSMVTDKLDWSEHTARWARKLILADKPLLGICYGHQIMAHAMGGVVDYNPNGKEQGTFDISLNTAGCQDRLFHNMPQSFRANLSHSQSVIKAPANTQVLAYNSHDKNQAIRYGKNAVSFQFHPEFTIGILKACMAGRKANTKGVFSPINQLEETPLSTALMRKFVFDL